MTGKTDYSEQEWTEITAAPPLAGLMVAASQRGGTFREALSMGKAYAEARQQHGSSQLLDEVVSTRPKVEHEHAHSPDELRDDVLGKVTQAVALVRAKGTEQEAADYTAFIKSLAERVASAHREGGEDVSDAERAALQALDGALAAPPASAA
ncbi:MAG TPA: hypothetical protein VNV44_08485 [Solirubrobacteraceae bacterium]|nr:hypothetical protein [Solirubrobacteraceae bacterium]